MTAPLANQRILITRAADQAADLVRLLALEGALTEELATIEIVAPESLDELDLQLLGSTAADWWIFTSANAVRAVAARLSACGRAWPRAPRLAAVGPATSAVLETHAGRAPDLVPVRQDGVGLAEALASGGLSAGARVLLPRGNLASPELPELLRVAGARVEEVVAYRTRPAALDGALLGARFQARAFQWITFASGSAFQSLAAALPDTQVLRGLHLACLGPRTAEVVRLAGFEVAAVGAQPTAPALVSAMRLRLDGR